MADEKYTPIRKYTFPAGECGGEIRITIPLFASKEDVQNAIEAMMVIAQKWKEAYLILDRRGYIKQSTTRPKRAGAREWSESLPVLILYFDFYADSKPCPPVCGGGLYRRELIHE